MKTAVFTVGLYLAAFCTAHGSPQMQVMNYGTYADYLSCYSKTNGEKISDIETLMKEKEVNSSWLPIRKHHLPQWVWLNGENFGTDMNGPGRNIEHFDCAAIQMRAFLIDNAACKSEMTHFICSFEDLDTCKTTATTQRETCVEIVNTYYLVIGESISWYMAQERCSSMGASLASFSDETVRTHFFKHLKKSNYKPSSGFWIGLRRAEFINDGKDTVVQQYRWGINEPATCTGCDCVSLTEATDGSLLWRTAKCDEKRTYFCWPEGREVTLTEEKHSYADRPNVCQLISRIDTDVFNSAIKAMKTQRSSVWLPIRRIDFGSWKWLNEDEYDGDIITKNKTLEGCAAILPNGGQPYYVASCCDAKLQYFICQKRGSNCRPKMGSCFTHGEYTYNLHNQNITWQEAKDSCYSRGASLVVIPEIKLRQRFNHILSGISDTWIGLRRHDMINSDYSQYHGSQWESSTPCAQKAKACVIISNETHRMKAEDCTARHKHICWKNEKVSTTKAFRTRYTEQTPTKKPTSYEKTDREVNLWSTILLIITSSITMLAVIILLAFICLKLSKVKTSRPDVPTADESQTLHRLTREPKEPNPSLVCCESLDSDTELPPYKL